MSKGHHPHHRTPPPPPSAAKQSRRGSSSDRDSQEFNVAYQKWINQQMEKRVSEYSDITPLSICCGTWNVNTRSLSENCNIKSWLIHQLYAAADIYAISLQEIVDLNVMNVVVNGKGSEEMSLYWQKAIHSAILETGMDYRLIFEKHMVGLALMVFVRGEHLPFINDIRHSVVYTGSYGVTGNKGGIAVRFDFHDSPFCFVGAHFHAGRENVTTRNLDFQTICEQAVFQPSATKPAANNGVHGVSDARPYSSSFKAMKQFIPWTIIEHEYIFWFGDLNYRITSDVDDELIFTHVQQGDWPALRLKDQLCVEREKGNVFMQFNEGVVNFPPTYKYQPGTDVYEQRPEKKLRAPAWCDRVLWRNSGAKDDVRLKAYDAIRLNISDHKPVAAWFDCAVKTFIQDRVRGVYQELLFAVDKWVNASTPKMSVENRLIDFGDILLDQKYYSTLTLRNIGNVMAEWAFVPKEGHVSISKPWLRFTPEDGILAPGETTTVKVTLCCSSEMTVSVITEQDMKGLEDIAILRLMKGSDFFVVVSGKLNEEHVQNARKSVRIIVANPIPTGKSKVQVTAVTGGNDRVSGRYPRTNVHSMRTDRSHSDDDDDDMEQELALEDIYSKDT